MPAVGPWARRGEAALVVVFLVSAAALAAVESRSPLASKLRSGEPIVLQLSVKGESGSSPYLGVYHPATRALDLVDLGPKGLASLGADAALVSPDLPMTLHADGPAPSDALGAKRLLSSWPHGARFWWVAARSPRPAGLSPYEAALLALELYRLNPAEIRPVWPPAAAHRKALLESLLRDAPPASLTTELRVEVQNASGEGGVALAATKALRADQVDVIDYGNAPAAEPETRVVDRAGRPRDARRVAELLGCPDAEVWTQYDPQAMSPVALVLGQDFRRCRRL
ncbi:MAG: LytR C-terminal domain-containing protein [Elusimicrobia bacterium]|nr:LytR C-terminal domain-containing protein [Elusimicrobiota bacterium]